MSKEARRETDPVSDPASQTGSFFEVLGVAARLGLTSFGGPVAHLGYFRDEYVTRRQWLDEKAYADLVALCQFLPGPASSQVGIAIGMIRAGLPGALAAWLGFTLPSAVALVLFAYVLQGTDVSEAGWLHGLMVVAVAVVAQAVWGMARTLAPDRPRATMAMLAAIAALTWPRAEVQVLIILAAGWIGWLLFREKPEDSSVRIRVPVSRRMAVGAWSLFFGFLIGLPLLRQLGSVEWLAFFDSFYRTGSLVFGGGHVVLPLLQSEVVPAGWVTGEEFIAGYGAAQAVPGPLFTFSAYLGAVTGGWTGAMVALTAIFLPSFFLVTGTLPFWEQIRRRPAFQAAFTGINAAVVGILLAALFDPVWTKAIQTSADFSLALVAFGLLMVWKLPPWVVVVMTAAGGVVLERLS